MKTKIWVLINICAFLVSDVFAYSGGSGDSNNPYQLENVADFQQLSGTPTDWSKSFILTNDIDLNGLIFDQAPIAPGTFVRWGYEGIPFSGSFDGNDHKIFNLSIQSPTKDAIGLFGFVDSEARIKNLGLEDVNVSGNGVVAALAGANYGQIVFCYATGSVTGKSDGVGGLVGSNPGGISCCFTTTSVKGVRQAGGLAGSNSGTVMCCYASGSASAVGYTNSSAGGLVGSNQGMITSCYSSGSVSGSGFKGGLVGYNRYWSPISACFWDVQTSGRNIGVGASVGGLIEVQGKTSEQMKNISTFISAGWDFINENANGLHDYWQMGTDDYPRLASQTWSLTGKGTWANPYIIATAEDLSKVWLRPCAYYRLEGNLDLAGISWSSAVIPVFTGVFDGQGFVISHLRMDQPGISDAGLFGYLESGGQINRLGVEDANIVGHNYVGALVGYNHGSVTSCYATGSVSGTGQGEGGELCVGGLVGLNYFGTLTFSYATDSVYGKFDGSQIGGLVGGNAGTVTCCYATGSTTGTGAYSTIGGLVGCNGYHVDPGNVRFCYSSGPVSGTGRYSKIGGLAGEGFENFTSCFWDTQTSGTAISAGGTGLETPVMRTKTTFTAAGWDFIGETGNGTEDIWMIHDGTDYPKFVWQNKTPEADAGLDKNWYAFINDKAIVELDGSGSSDADGGALTYKWTWETGGKIYEANGVRPTIELPVGVHTIQLMVNDGIVDSAPDDVNVTIVGAAEGTLKITPNAINYKNKQEQISALIGLPSGISTNDLDESWTMTMYPGEIKAVKQTYQAGGTEILAIFDKNTVCAAGTGNVEFKVAGKLKSGQYFYGSDKIKIIH